MLKNKKGVRKNAYKVLQIDKETPTKTIRKAYISWKKKVVQNGAGGEDENQKRARDEEQAAFDILTNDNKRQKYDEALQLERRQLLARIKKHCFNDDSDPASITGDDFEDLDTEQLRRVYVIYDTPASFKVLKNIRDDDSADDKQEKGTCLEERTLMHMLNAHRKKNENGVSPPWANPNTRAPLSKDLAQKIMERIHVRNIELASAIDAQDEERVEFLIENGANVNTITSEKKQTPLLHYAILKSVKLPVIKALLEGNANVNLSDVDGLTTILCAKYYYKGDKDALIKLLKEHGTDLNIQLIWAIKGGNLKGAADLCDMGANVNALVLGSPILIHAISMNLPLESIEFILSKGANVNLSSVRGDTAIFGIAVYGGEKLELTKLLLNHGADVNHVNSTGTDPLYWVITQLNDVPLVKALLDHGASVARIYPNPHHTILTLAMRADRSRNILNMLLDKDAELINQLGFEGPPLAVAISKQSNRLFDWCMEQGANVDFVNRSGRNALMFAVMKGTEYMVNRLLQNRTVLTRINHVDAEGNNVLHWAVSVYKPDTIQQMVELGADIDQRNRKGQTPLHIAIIYRNAEVAKYLIDKNANTIVPDHSGNMPIYIALNANMMDVFEKLWSIYKMKVPVQQYDSYLLLLACQSETPKIVREMLKAGMNARIIDRHTGASCLSFAVASMHDKQTLQLLIDYGVDVQHADKEKRTALMNAAMREHRDAIELLLSNGADVDSKDLDGATALHLSMASKDPHVIVSLIKKGANVNAVDENKNTPLIHASDYMNPTAMRIILEAGADPNMKNTSDLAAIDFLAEKYSDENAQECLDILIEHNAVVPDHIRDELLSHGLKIKERKRNGGRKTKLPKTTKLGKNKK